MAGAERETDGTVAVWGTFDLENFGDQLYPRITENEIVRRLPGWMVRTYSPFGWERPCRMDGGFVSEPLGVRANGRTAQLAAAADLTLVGGGDLIHFDHETLAKAYGVDGTTMRRRSPGHWFVEGLGPELERRSPVVWNAVGVPGDPAQEHAELIQRALGRRRYVAVRDHASAQRLRACGVQQDIEVVPDIGFLLHRLIRNETLKSRVDYFRFMGWYPANRPALIVQGNRAAIPLAKEIAKVVRWAVEEQHIRAEVVLLEAGPCHGDGEFADVLAGHIAPQRIYRLPASLPPEDVLAAVYGATGTIATSYHVTIAAAMFGRRWAVLDPATGSVGTSKLRSLAELLERPEQCATNVGELAEAIRIAFPQRPDPKQYLKLLVGVDRHFDMVAEAAERAWRANGGSSEHRWAAVRAENVALRAAYRASRLRLATERRRLIDFSLQPGVTRGGPAADLAKLREDSAELNRLMQTKLVRWSRPVRMIYSKLTGRQL